MSNINVTIDRYKYVGGSDLPTILGLNMKYDKKPYDLALEKARIVPNSFNGNQFTKYGQKMEPVIRDYINSKYQVNYLEDTIIDETKHYRGNTDGIDRNADIPILEVKTFGNELDVDYYTAQCQFYMKTFNQDACLLVGYKRPDDFYTGIDYDLEHDDSYFNFEFDPNNLVEHIIYRDENMWNKIEERIIAFRNGVTYLQENRENFTEEEFNKIFYGYDLVQMTNTVTDLETKLDSMKKIELEYKKAKDDLYKLFDEKGLISIDTGMVRITKISPTSYDTVSIDTKKLKEENEKIYNKYKVVKRTNKKGYILITLKNKESEK